MGNCKFPPSAPLSCLLLVSSTTPSIFCSQTNSLGLIFKQTSVSRFALSVCTSQEDLSLRRDSSSALFSRPRSYKGVFDVTAEQVSVHCVHRHVLASSEFRMTSTGSLAGTPEFAFLLCLPLQHRWPVSRMGDEAFPVHWRGPPHRASSACYSPDLYFC